MTATTTDQPLALLRPEEFAAAVNLGRTTVYAELRAGRVRSVKVGRRRLIPAEEVGRYVDLLRSEAAAAS